MMQETERFNPFPGLRPFEPEEDHLFFGRERHVNELLKRLRSNRFLAVIGGSGSGKSSLVRAGVIPSLYSGYMVQAGSSWRVAIMRPGGDPIGNLAEVLDQPDILGIIPELAATNRMLIETTLRRSNLGLADCVRQARLPAADNLLIVIDQFEELFRFRRSRRVEQARDEAVAFVKRLLQAVRQEDLPVYVLITMRSDFIGDCIEYTGLPEAINAGQYLVPRMTRNQLRTAITGPVAVGGGQISPRLVVRLLNELGDDPDQLPVMQHALMRTWDCWVDSHEQGVPLDFHHYEEIGTMLEALSRHAEEAYTELGSERAKGIAEKLFKALTDTGSDSRGIRRPTSVAELSKIASADQDEIVPVIDCFRRSGRSFLMPSADTPLARQTIVDISHESLMRCWKRLIGWTKEEKASAEVYVRMAQAAARYQQGTAGLWRDPELQLGLIWRKKNQPTQVWARQYDPSFDRTMQFLDSSQKERDRQIAEKERMRRNKLRIAWSVAIVLLVFALYALFQKSEAEKAQHLAEHNLQLAKKAVDNMLTEVGRESLADVPQMEEIRQELLEKARIFYDMFQKQKPANPEFRMEKALAHSRLGDIYRLRGQNDKAEDTYKEALAQLTSLHEEFPGQPVYQFHLAETYIRYGEQLRPYDSSGAEKAYDRALALQKDLVQQYPQEPEYKREMALVHNNRGIVLSHQNSRAKDAETNYREAIAILQALLSGHDDAFASLRLAQTFNNLASLLRQYPDRRADAKELYIKAIEVIEASSGKRPDKREYKEEAAKFYNNLGNLLNFQGELKPALEANQQALQLFEELAAPVRGLRNELANSYNSRGSVLAKLSRMQKSDTESRRLQAVEAYQQSIQIFAGLERDFNDFPQDSDINARYANALANLGVLHMASNNFEEAVRLLTQAVTYYSRALVSGASKADYRRNLVSIYWVLAETHLRWGNHKAAAEAAAAPPQLLPDKENYYRAAKVLTRAIRLTRGDETQSGKQRVKLAQAYATQAVLLLERAVADGYSIEKLKADAGASGPFYPLREHQSLRKLLGEN